MYDGELLSLDEERDYSVLDACRDSGSFVNEEESKENNEIQ